MYSAFLTVLIPSMPFNIALAVILVGVGYSTFSLKLQRRLTNPQKTRDMQAKINALTKQMNEMAKRNEDVTAKQAELMPLIRESMQAQMKSMFVILPVFFLIYYGALPFVFGGFAAEAFTVIVPLNYTSLFIVTAIAFGLILSLGILIKDKLVLKAQKQVQPAEA